MKVVLEGTGEAILLTRTSELARDLEEFRASDCMHPRTEWRRYFISNGSLTIRAECQDCGYLLGNPRKQKAGDDELPVHDPSRRKLYEAARRKEEEAIHQKHAKKQRDKDTDWHRDHSAYLKTPEWMARRDKVIRRAGGLCEGCGDKPATQAHHRTYDHWQNEFLFELLALCEECHSRLHKPSIVEEDLPDIDDESDEPGDWLIGPCDGCRFAAGLDNDECGLSGEPSILELSEVGSCGPTRRNFLGLK